MAGRAQSIAWRWRRRLTCKGVFSAFFTGQRIEDILRTLSTFMSYLCLLLSTRT